MAIAIAVSLVGIFALGWQYRQLEKQRLPAIEEKIERVSAQRVLDKFMLARLEKDEKEARFYLTEGAMEQLFGEEFFLIGDWQSYELLNQEKLEENKYRFVVKLHDEENRGSLVEIIILIDILDNYYIDSVEIAG